MICDMYSETKGMTRKLKDREIKLATLDIIKIFSVSSVSSRGTASNAISATQHNVTVIRS